MSLVLNSLTQLISISFNITYLAGTYTCRIQYLLAADAQIHFSKANLEMEDAPIPRIVRRVRRGAIQPQFLLHAPHLAWPINRRNWREMRK